MNRPLSLFEILREVNISGNIMENGETRTRMISLDGSGCLMTKTTIGSWQKSHTHKKIKEVLAPQKSWIAYANQDKKGLNLIQIILPGNFIIIGSEPHNVYVSANTLLYCIKSCEAPEGEEIDWYPASTEFDQWTQAFHYGRLLEMQQDTKHHRLCGNPQPLYTH